MKKLKLKNVQIRMKLIVNLKNKKSVNFLPKFEIIVEKLVNATVYQNKNN